MQRRTYIVSALKCAVFLSMGFSALAQQRGQAPAAQRQPVQRPPLFFRENWKETVEVPVTQAFVTNPDLELKLYGPSSKDLQVTAEGQPPHIWTGLCTSPCALALKHKGNYVDDGSRQDPVAHQSVGFPPDSPDCQAR